MADARPTNTAQLLALIDAEWQPLLQLAARLTPDQMTRPDAGGWSPKDNLAHLAAWMRYMMRAYVHKMPGHEAMGIEAGKWKQLDENGINAVLFERNRDLTPAQVLEMLRSTYADVTADLRTVPFDDLLRPLREGPNGTLSVLDLVIGNTVEHFLEHRRNIEKGL
ncbi:MAG TPA: ClbS/DfsB family four-helix bundle protein [Ramlibacter sp.]|nr:ClbS/DfsB family four-helix bundle protein [Ramlibacter sp.]